MLSDYMYGKEDIMKLKSKTLYQLWTDRRVFIRNFKVMERDKTWKTITSIVKSNLKLDKIIQKK